MSVLAKKIVWQWDRVGRKLWANILTGQGQMIRVGFPLAHVAMTFDEELAHCGIVEPPMVGDYETVDGFLGRVKRAAKRHVRTITSPRRAISHVTRSAARGFIPQPIFRRITPKPIRRAQARLAQQAVRLHQAGYTYGKRYGLKAARSKELGAGLGVAAVAFPAVGGPALGAWTAANRAAKYYDAAQAAKRAIQQGRGNPRLIAQAARGAAVQQAVQRLPYQNDPRARLAMSALRSIPQTSPYARQVPGYY